TPSSTRWTSRRLSSCRTALGPMAFDHNDHYHPLLLRQVPSGAATALDVGCGTGLFARGLAARGVVVDAVDPAREVIETAWAPVPARRHHHDGSARGTLRLRLVPGQRASRAVRDGARAAAGAGARRGARGARLLPGEHPVRLLDQPGGGPGERGGAPGAEPPPASAGTGAGQ